MSQERIATLRNDVLALLRGNGWTLAFAESCTGGLLSASVTELAGVSDVFLGSVVSYSNEAKKDLLHVDDRTLKSVGAVSEETAREMVRGACRALRADAAVAVTGIAGPSGGTPDKPVGTVCFAAAVPGGEASATRHFAGDRVSVQRQSVEFALEFLERTLREERKRPERPRE